MELVETTFGPMWLFDLEEEKKKPNTLVERSMGYSCSESIRNGSFESSNVEVVKSFVEPGMTCIDVGANLGVYTILMRSQCGPTGTVFAFEPNAAIVKLLRKTCHLRTGIKVHPFGLHDHEGLYTYRPGTEWSQSFEVKRARDVFQDLDHVDFLKLDIDGPEAGVLASMSSLIDRSSRMVALIEYSRLWPRAGYNITEFFDLLKALRMDYGLVRNGQLVNVNTPEPYLQEPRVSDTIILWKGCEPILRDTTIVSWA